MDDLNDLIYRLRNAHRLNSSQTSSLLNEAADTLSKLKDAIYSAEFFLRQAKKAINMQ